MAAKHSRSSTPNTAADPKQYVVLARRYRPQTFAELVGQEHVAQALSNAIANHHVGHAYLFTGARGVGKTSTARILAKALNCERGPTPVPCNRCDACQRIAAGEDVDVLEIDGASNRGIEEVRLLRQNAAIRPSRSRFKIYVIDEVHMLTREAFNALLKTLEEPPEHVKFIFCTTEPAKIPITILSRCQRFDFAGIETGAIRKRLEQILEAEGKEAEAEALEILARRAAGSMRDSQSLLEQLLAFAPGKITAKDVYELLGAADEEHIVTMLEHLQAGDPAAMLADLDRLLAEGVDISQLVEQLLCYLRDCLAAAAGCQRESFLFAPPAVAARIEEIGRRWGLQNLLAAMQIIDQALMRMRYSTQGRLLAEAALVRICRLETLQDISELIEQLRTGGVAAPAAVSAPAAAVKKKYEPAEPMRASAGAPSAQPGNLKPAELWHRALSRLSGAAIEMARQFHKLEMPSPEELVIWFNPEYAIYKSICETPAQKTNFEQAVAEVCGRRVRVEFRLLENLTNEAAPAGKALSNHQRLLAAAKHPLVRLAGELFGAQPVRVNGPSENNPTRK